MEKPISVPMPRSEPAVWYLEHVQTQLKAVTFKATVKGLVSIG